MSEHDTQLRPEAALLPGRGDAARLLSVWYVRKSFYWVLFVGVSVAAINHDIENIEIDWTDPQSVFDGLFSPIAAIIVAFMLRILTSLVALAFAYPLSHDYAVRLDDRRGFLSAYGRWMDRVKVAQGLRALRWTHTVRQLALTRLGPAGPTVARLDPILDIVNITSAVAAFAVLTAVADTTT